jgi:TetR/AcrR family transcriptional regulator, fatty acid metabolism regulator protein
VAHASIRGWLRQSLMTDNGQIPEDKKSVRERILDSALNIFSRKGYHDTRLDEIVDDSATSKGSIYFHFPNKERLFLALVDQFADLIERKVTDAIVNEPQGMGRVRAALESVLNTFAKYRRPAKLLLVQAVGLGSVFEKKRMEITDRFAALIRTYLQEAIDIGDIEPVNVHVVSHAWMGAIYNVVIQWVYTGEPEREQILSALLPMLLRSVGYAPEEMPSS